MDILRAYFSVFGRLNRTDYGMILLTGHIIPLGFFFYLESMGPLTDESDAIELFLVGLMIWVFFAALAKRLHDIGKSGLACLLVFIPIVGQFMPLILLFLSGTEGSNDYGTPQKYFLFGR